MKTFFAFLFGTLSFFFVLNAFAVEPEFSDVDSSHQFYDAVEYVKSEGIARGYSDGTFGVDKEMNRVEFLKVVLEAQKDFTMKEAGLCLADSSIDLPKDVILQEWYTPYVCYAMKHNIAKGYPDGLFRPTQTINVPEMAKILVNTQKIATQAVEGQWYLPYLNVLSEKRALPTTLSSLLDPIHRGEMAEILYRVKTNRMDKSSLDADILESLPQKTKTGELGKVAQCSELLAIMKRSVTSYDAPFLYEISTDEAVPEAAMDAGAVVEETTVATAVPTSEKSSSSDYSKTNVQVEGVDEADIVKNDGKYIYLIKNNTLRIVNAYPAESMKEVSVFSFPDENFSPQELFVDGNTLVAIGSSWKSASSKMFAPGEYYPMNSSQTVVFVVNIEKREKPEVIRTVSYDGSLSKSRRIGNIAYLVLNKRPNFYPMPYFRGIPEVQMQTSADSVLPMMSDSATENGKKVSACGCEDVSYFPGFESVNFLMVSAIPLNDLAKKIETEVMLGSSENIYMSPSALYVATGAPDVSGNYFWSWDNTQVYKFNIDGMVVDFAETAKVPGRILNQFSMDEYKNTFRIATTKGEVWSGEEASTNRVYTFDANMKQLGALENIAPGERIYSVRFMGDRAFMVTFKTVDPLFVLSLKDPAKPEILGELKIPGWSDYLHPYDENHLIGFGKEVDASIDADKVHSDNAVYYTAVQGLKVSLFDVTDLKNPKESFKYVVGDRGTESDILYDHKALFFQKENNLLAFPITIQTKKTGASSAEYEQFQTTFSGALVLSIDLKNGIQEKARISNYVSKDYDQQYFYADWEKRIQRVVSIGKNLYTVSLKTIQAVNKETFEPLAKLDLEGSNCPQYIDAMPKIIEDGQTIPAPTIPEGCEGITEIVY